MSNFALFMLSFILVGLIILGIFTLWNFHERLINKIIVFRLKRRIRKNPSLDEVGIDNTHLYEDNGYCIRYKIVTPEAGKKRLIKWISFRYRLRPSERMIKSARRIFAGLLYDGNWLSLFRPSLIILLLTGTAIFYFGLLESQESKRVRLKWIASRLLGVRPNQVKYAGGGWFEVLGTRKTIEDSQEEPIVYTVNFWKWLSGGSGGYLKRQREKPYGDDINQLRFDNAGNIWLKKEGEWRRGKVTKDKIEWSEPQGTGISEGKISGHRIVIEDKELRIVDE